MDQNQAYTIQTIRNHLLDKQLANPGYSLRAFARDVDMHPSTLSLVLNGKRSLTYRDAQALVRRLRLSSDEQTRFMNCVLKSKMTIDEIKVPDFDQRHIIDDTHYQVIAEWEHFAVLELFDLKKFVCTPVSVSRKLGVSEDRAVTVIENLLNAELIRREENGTLLKVHDDIRTTEDVLSRALRASHIETLEMGVEKLEEVPLEFRDYSSATLSIDSKKIPEAKAVIREFRQKMRALLATGEKDDVYQLAIQFYPLTAEHRGDLQ